MQKLKKILNHIFIDGLTGMASGLFATLIIGTIIAQVGTLLGGDIGHYMILIGKAAQSLTGAGIGVGVATKYGESVLVTVSAASAGMIGAFASKIISGAFLVNGAVVLAGPGEPLGAFVAAFMSITVAHLVAGKTKVDIIITPAIGVITGGAVGLLVGPPISKLMSWLGGVINYGTEQQPFIMGIIVAIIMGMVLTLPISSAAIAVVLGLQGLAAGAAAVGCCANMIGFAVASYQENKFGGLIAQGLGTSMLQVPNILKRPIIWLPAILTSAILGPISTCLVKMTNNAMGAGMGTSGLVGQINAYDVMTSAGASSAEVLLKIGLMHFVAPAILALLIANAMRKLGWIRKNDMLLKV